MEKKVRFRRLISMDRLELVRREEGGSWVGAAVHPSSKRRGWWQITMFNAEGLLDKHLMAPSKAEAVMICIDRGFLEESPGLLQKVITGGP